MKNARPPTHRELLQDAIWDRSIAGVRAAIAAGATPATQVQVVRKRGANSIGAWAAVVHLAWAEAVALLPPPRLATQNASNVFYWARHDDVATYRTLLEHAHPPDAEAFLQAGLSRAAKAGHYEAVRFLLDRGASPDGARGKGAPLGRAARPEVAQLLLARGARLGGRPDADAKHAPLAQAAGRSPDVLRLLLQAGAPRPAAAEAAALRAAACARAVDNLRLLDAYGVDVASALAPALAYTVEAALAHGVDPAREGQVIALLEMGADPAEEYAEELAPDIYVTHPSMLDTCRQHLELFPRTVAFLASK